MANVNDEDDVSMTSPELLSGTTPIDAITMADLLSYPTEELVSCRSNDPPISIPSTSSSSSRQLLKDRLFIGNLNPNVDEYTLLQIFTKFGKVTKLDFLFHKAGALKGKPRGYAFIEYGTHHEAQKALTLANGKMLLGRKLVVTHAHQAPPDADGGFSRQKKTMMETGRPTTLSMLKSSNAGRKHKEGTSDKIAMMEAKLRELEASKPKINPEPGTSTLQTSSLPSHPSLPLKPPPASSITESQTQRSAGFKHHPPSLLVSRPSASTPSSCSSLPGSEPLMKKPRIGLSATTSEAPKRKNGGKSLLGVKIGKKRSRLSPMPNTPPDGPTILDSAPTLDRETS